MFSIEVDGVTKDIFSPELLNDDLVQELQVFAKEVIRDEQVEGFAEDPVIAVDGSFKKKISDVKPFGKIEFLNTGIDIGDDLIAAYKRIDDLSPVGNKRPGDRFANVKYKDYNYVYYNNFLVAQTSPELRNFIALKEREGFEKGDEIMFINVAPYARKLERLGVTSSTVGAGGRDRRVGKGRQKGTTIEKPNGTYYAAQRTIKSLMKGRAFVNPVKYIRFDISVGGMPGSFHPKKGSGNKWTGPYLYPAIIVKPITGKGVVQ